MNYNLTQTISSVSAIPVEQFTFVLMDGDKFTSAVYGSKHANAVLVKGGEPDTPSLLAVSGFCKIKLSDRNKTPIRSCEYVFSDDNGRALVCAIEFGIMQLLESGNPGDFVLARFV